MGRLWERYRFIFMGVVLALVTVAGAIEVIAARNGGVADWYMHLAMWLLLLVYFLLTSWTVLSGRVVRAIVNLLLLEGLSLFWIFILWGKIPAQKAVIDGRLTLREPLYEISLAIILLGVAALVLPLLTVIAIVQQRRRRQPPPRQGD